MLIFGDLVKPKPLRSGWLRVWTNFQPLTDEIPGDIAAHWTLCRTIAQSREWKSWWTASQYPWVEIRPMPVDDFTYVGSSPLNRGYLVRANLQGLDEVSRPLVYNFRVHNRVTQDELDAFEDEAYNAYAVIFAHLRQQLQLPELPSMPARPRATQ